MPMAADASPPTGLKSHILRSLVKLPPMPQVILQAREVVENPDAGLRDLARIIESDQALVAKVLSLANSAYYGISGQVSSVQHAAVLLGLKALGDLVILSASSVFLDRDLPGYRMAPQAVWRHSLATALLARAIAGRGHPGLEADAFIVGLLHDAGKLILEPFVVAHRAQGSPEPAPDAPLGCELERRWFGLDHAEAIALACRFWRFPEAQVKGVRFHHEPALSSRSALAHVAHLANALAYRAGVDGGDAAGGEIAASTLEFLDMDAAELDPLQAEMTDAIDGLEAAMPAG
ncbi:MAG TPA: HDOD domain-containing protein [Desulfobacterales bacterium]|nr:HDOD domain-containing protein [Desulfobacterales bacterium]